MKTLKILTILFLLASLSLPAGATLSASTSTSTSEVTTGNSFTVTATISNTATSGTESGVTLGIDLSLANGGLSLEATGINLQNTTASTTITAGNQLTQTWTIYTRSAGVYTNQIKITTKQNNEEVSGISPKYESVTVKDPAAFATPSITTNTTVEVNTTFNLNLTTQNTGDYSIENATVSINDSENSIQIINVTNNNTQNITSSGIFSSYYQIRFTSASTHTLTITYSSDNAATTTKTTTISVTSSDSTPTTTTTTSSRGGGGGGSSLPPATTQSRILQKGTVKFTGKVGEYISQITIPGAAGSIEVKILDKNPTKQTPQVKALKYLEINPGSNKDKTGKITFKITDQELTKHGLTRDKISLYRYTDRWNELPTTLKTTTPQGENTYEAETPGFSTFMIAEKAAQTTTPKPTAQPETQTKTTPKPQQKQTPPPQTPDSEKTSSKNSLLLPGILVILLGGAIGVYTYKKKNSQK